MTFPKRIEDNPTFATFPGKNLEAHYSEDLLAGYRWYDQKKVEPLLPFGHGLSCTSFAYGGMKLRKSGKGWQVSFAVRNIGKRAGAEIAQLYLAFPLSANEPERQLKRFQRVDLKPGRAQRVTFEITDADMRIWDTSADDRKVESGTYQTFVGGSSQDLPLNVRWER